MPPVSVVARPAGDVGHYEATFVFPSAGEWKWEIQPFGKQAGGYPATEYHPFVVQPATTQPFPGSESRLETTVLEIPSLNLAQMLVVAGFSAFGALIALGYLLVGRNELRQEG